MGVMCFLSNNNSSSSNRPVVVGDTRRWRCTTHPCHSLQSSSTKLGGKRVSAL